MEPAQRADHVIEVDLYPGLDVRVFITRLPAEVSAAASPEWLRALLSIDAATPLRREETTRTAIRELLRQRGYKPTGRGKPASEYLVRAAQEGALRSINAAVDCCNVVSLHSGLPISVIDVERAETPFRIAAAPITDTYVFNPAGQVIAVGGLPCVFDALGPCANAVKDAQRTKTSESTRTTLSVIWSAAPLTGVADAALEFYRALLTRCGAEFSPVRCMPAR